MNKVVLQSIIDDLKAGRTPQLSSEDFPCFSAEALTGNNHVAPDYLDVIAKSLTEADIPTFERAIRAVDEGDLAWLGFKVIYDAAEAQRNTEMRSPRSTATRVPPTASRSSSSATTRRKSSPRARRARAIRSR